MNQSVKLTIVIPVRDRRTLLTATLGCVEQALRHVPFDVVVVDNGSADGSGDVARNILGRIAAAAPESGRFTVVDEPKPGACAARNRGLREVVTPYVMFFDSDDSFDAHLPARITEAVSVTDAPDIVAWEVEYTDHTPMPPTRLCRRRGHHLFHGTLATQRYAVRTGLIREVGGWNENLPVWNDLELGVRLLGSAPFVAFLDGEPPVRVLRHADSITGSRFSDRPGERERSLDAIELYYRRTRRLDMLAIVDARRLILADTYRREGATGAARQLREVVRSHRHNLITATSLRLIAAVQRLLGRGGSALALRLL